MLRWHGRSELLALLGFSIVGSFFVDYLLDLPWILRFLLLGFFLFAIVRCFRRARQRQRFEIPPHDLLETVEKRFRELDGQLMNYTELGKETRRENPFEQDELRSHLLKRAVEEAEAAVEEVRYDQSLNVRPLVQRSALATLALGFLLIVVTSTPENFGHWALRNILLSNEAWPRSTHFAFENEDRVFRHARGDALEIRAWVLGEVPRSVKLHIVTDSGEHTTRLVPGQPERRRWHVASIETAGAPDDRKRIDGHPLSYSAPDVRTSLEYYFSGGDNQSVPVRVEVRDRPRLTVTQFTIQPPEHTGVETSVIRNPAGEISMPVLSQVRVELRADQELREAWYQLGGPPARSLDIAEAITAETRFTLENSAFLDLGLSGGEWNLKARTSRYVLVAIPDRVPDARLTINGESRLYTPDAQVDYTVEGEDDYGFSSMQLKLAKVSEGETDEAGGVTSEHLIDLQPWNVETTDHGARARVDRVLALRPLDLAVGTRLLLQAQVTDNDSPGGLKTGLSQIETIVIVSRDELRREMDKLRVEIQTRLEDLADVERALEESLAKDENTAQDEAQDAPSETKDSPAKEPARRQEEIAAEVQKIAEKTREMTETLERNQALTDEEKRRLEDEVQEPLDELAEDRLPRSSQELGKMSQSEQGKPKDVARARQEMQNISEQMEQVAKSLGETENFREVLQRMKAILELQEKVIEKTGQTGQTGKGQQEF